MITPRGWIPRQERTSHQMLMTREHDAATPTFGQVNAGLKDLPKRCLLYENEKKATGALLPRIRQYDGSCVGAAGGRSYAQTMCGDIVHRKTKEEVPLLFPWTTWGIGRQLANMRGRGAGSFGAAQAKAVSTQGFGMNRADNPKLPQPKISKGWAGWSFDVERSYSWPPSWPVSKAELEQEANSHQMEYFARIKSLDELKQAFAQGYGVTCASMFGTRPRIENGRLVGRWNDSWAHQMSWSGYDLDDAGRLFVPDDNQWGAEAHPSCPILSALGVFGSFWIPEDDVVKCIDRGEVFAHGNSEDWPVRELNWSESLGIGE